MIRSCRLLFVLKRRQSYWGPDEGGELSSGLRNSVRFVVDMLHDLGIAAKMVEVADNNCIDREVAAYRPTHCIVEAFWVVPEKFDVLKKLHPEVQWIVRNHSELPFLANEGIAVEWAAGYLARGVEVMCNSPRALVEIRSLAGAMRFPERMISYGPNFYPVRHVGHDAPHCTEGHVHIGCFGAIRPLKNHLSQAVAALSFASDAGLHLHFHINASRVEGNGGSILKNLRGLFANAPRHDLVEHPWMSHQDFLEVMAQMDMALQVSFSETFNIVSADAVAVERPGHYLARSPLARRLCACRSDRYRLHGGSAVGDAERESSPSPGAAAARSRRLCGQYRDRLGEALRAAALNKHW
jgi:hypothetical protein